MTTSSPPILLPDILVRHFGWSPALRPRTGKNKGRYTAAPLGEFSIAPMIGNRNDRLPYAVHLGDLFPRGTVWDTAVPEIFQLDTPVAIDGPLVAWGTDFAQKGVTFLTVQLKKVTIRDVVFCRDLYSWRLVAPSPADELARAVATKWTVMDHHYDKFSLSDIATRGLEALKPA